MRYLVVVSAVLAAVGAASAANTGNIAASARVTCEPALDGPVTTLIDGKLASVAFKVGSKGPGAVTFAWDVPRQVSKVRFQQASDQYRMDACVVEGDSGGKGVFTSLAESKEAPLRRWVEIAFPETAVMSLRLRATAGESKGQRAYPCFSEIQVVGVALATDMQTAQKLGNPASGIPNVLPARQSTPLVSNGQAPVILAPAAGPGQDAARQLATALEQKLGQPVAVVSTLEAAPLGKATVIALGSLLDNPLIDRLYWSRYTFEDNLFPGPDGYTVHTVYDPYPWGGGQDVIILGASRPEKLAAAVERFLGAVQGVGAEASLPYTLIVEPSRQLADAARQKLLDTPADPSFTDFRKYAELYLQSGEAAYAQKAKAALDIMVDTYAADPARHVPWPEETTSGEIAAAWDAFEECPLLPAERRAAYVNVFLSFTGGLVGNCYEYKKLADDDFIMAWNHTTFPLLGLYFGSRYFDRYYHLSDVAEWLRRAKLGFTKSARSAKAPEDADSYITHTMAHIIHYSLAEGDLRFFTSGKMKEYADYVVGYGDNRQWQSGFGDSGVSSRPTAALETLPFAYWWTKDGAYRWILEHIAPDWKNPYWPDIPAVPAERFVGLNVFPMDPIIYAYTQKGPTYAEQFKKADVSAEQAFDKISFRENWDVTGQYLQLDGLGRGKHLHFDTNAIIEFVQDGERWLLDHDYLTRNTTEHAMLSVLRNGRGEELVPSLAGLAASGELPDMAATLTWVKDYNGTDWERRILWRKGGWFLVQDTVTARGDADYDFEVTWKTVDRGNQRVEPDGRFVASRTAANVSHGLNVIDDPGAQNGKAAVLSDSTARLVFGVDLPADAVTVNVVASCVDTGSDSVWLSIDGGEPVACHLSIGKYGPSSSQPSKDQPNSTLKLERGGQHVVKVTLRENAPVRLDRIEFTPAGAQPVVVEAETAPAPDPALLGPAVDNSLYIESAVPVGARVTNHERKGMSVPISILHQRVPRKLEAGETATFCSLMFATDARHATNYRVTQRGDRLYRIAAESGDAVAGFGAVRRDSWQCDAAAWLVEGATVSAVACRSLGLGGGRLSFEPAADVQFDAAQNKLSIRTRVATTVTAEGATLDGTAQLTPGAAERTVTGFDAAALKCILEASAGSEVAPNPATAEAPAAKPLWTAELGKNVPVLRLTPIDFGGGKPVSLLVASGSGASRLDDGKVTWTFFAKGIVRDVAPLRLTKGAPPDVLVSSVDTYYYVVDATGSEVRKQQMTGIYFSADHGEKPWQVWCTRAFDTKGQGVDDLIVTTLASMESWGLDVTGKKLWRTLAAYHGCMDLRAADIDGDGRLKIVVADKYGSVRVLAPDGSALLSSNTSIGDVAFDFLPTAGGKMNIVHGSSTGDLKCCDSQGKDLWRFDNYGYAVERIVCADVNGDGKPEVLIASATGYLFCLDADGQTLWARRVGFMVHDLALTGGLIVAGTEDGMVAALDGQGQEQWRVTVEAPVMKLAVLGETVACGLGDGRVLGLPVRP
ncbi:MAG: hypothetical protein A3K19_10965 [Lentisphaerae bacterium RIFOXYB12_FULL_65_16]|nr:MAG: hypothetical protein A3K18_18170 [Lentisphaerae bacterium RIFOXYA12_64_32]OGV87863.1 MAG: hypothetical protein A3K19_10965 [Lentisphaerae bacterium RIFOXYB12_FULL_65_16]